MKLENQVCTIAQAKRLKELGIIQESIFFFWSDYDGYGANRICLEKWNNGREPECSIFTSAELGAMLPKRLKASWKQPDTTGLGGEWQSSCNCSIEYRFDGKKNVYIVSYPLVASYSHRDEAKARAGLLICLLEQKLITSTDVNESLKAE